MDETSYGRDDDRTQHQHSAVLGPSYRKVEAREPEEKEYETEKHSLRECPRVPKSAHGSSQECPRECPRVPTTPRPLPRDEAHSSNMYRDGPEQFVRDWMSFVYTYLSYS